MTQNQIAYANAQELKRHNTAAEQENQRHNIIAEAYEKWKNELSALQLKETQRANLANESIKRRQAELSEQQNAINASAIAETARHNAAVEQLTSMSTASQNALNSALSGQASANAVASYAAAALNKEKITTEKSVQGLNIANAGYTATQNLNYPYQTDYVISQSDLNKAKIQQVKADIKQTQVRTVHEGVNTLWDSVKGALNLITSVRNFK